MEGMESITCNNSWNMEKIQFNLIVQDDEREKEYSILGNCKELGAWRRPIKLQSVAFSEKAPQLLRAKLANP